ncbi:MAG: alpha/beta fold hydrolase, partial [Anaerolineae bacterium]|nr:alpha/beta fold hydrolase [Anaerolineae bacterium]
MAIFVLAHGSFQGGWAWWKVTPLLREMGHSCTTPTYTGLGERSHLLAPEVGLRMHVQDVLQHVRYERLTDFILVGHSYGGAVISEVAEHLAGRIRRLVYLDAFIPEHGKTLYDQMPAESVENWLARTRETEHGRVIAPFGAAGMGIKDPQEIALIDSLLSDEPEGTHTQPVLMPAHAAEKLPRSYVWCAERAPFIGFAQRAREEGWDY